MNDVLTKQLARVNLYALVSRIMMKEVDEEFLEKFEADEMILSFFPNYQGWEKPKELSHKNLLEQFLNVDFTNLFVLHLIPYESFYFRDDQMLETGGDNPVVQIYNEYDFRVQLDKARTVSPDHIGIELEFMYMLASSEYKALENKDYDAACQIARIQRDFLRDHLLQWAPMFLQNVKAEAGTPFYFDAASLTLEFMLSDYEYLNELITEEGCNYTV
ncbi:TorD/DmsD family molecular chaperone [Hydrogenimonas cancrithermarum]|uniref:Dehydrogenase n=1 Tax=Hydrogenimonas cancrithermarum TaxID=2993563 RepID=A0ABN6WXA3_9BACT|nr:molecular chaperone TorD family protein [Hydrogenimonas cancrithermarum]BDY13812.1 dehydrogenase [Hydrogenimonas cancrithermarum]